MVAERDFLYGMEQEVENKVEEELMVEVQMKLLPVSPTPHSALAGFMGGSRSYDSVQPYLELDHSLRFLLERSPLGDPGTPTGFSPWVFPNMKCELLS